MNEKGLDPDAVSFTISMDITQRMRDKTLVCDKPGWEHIAITQSVYIKGRSYPTMYVRQ